MAKSIERGPRDVAFTTRRKRLENIKWTFWTGPGRTPHQMSNNVKMDILESPNEICGKHVKVVEMNVNIEHLSTICVFPAHLCACCWHIVIFLIVRHFAWFQVWTLQRVHLTDFDFFSGLRLVPLNMSVWYFVNAGESRNQHLRTLFDTSFHMLFDVFLVPVNFRILLYVFMFPRKSRTAQVSLGSAQSDP